MKEDEQKQYTTVYRGIHMVLGEGEFNYIYLMLYLVTICWTKWCYYCIHNLFVPQSSQQWIETSEMSYIWSDIVTAKSSLVIDSKRENGTAVFLTWPKLKH